MSRPSKWLNMDASGQVTGQDPSLLSDTISRTTFDLLGEIQEQFKQMDKLRNDLAHEWAKNEKEMANSRRLQQLLKVKQLKTKPLEKNMTKVEKRLAETEASLEKAKTECVEAKKLANDRLVLCDAFFRKILSSKTFVKFANRLDFYRKHVGGYISTFVVKEIFPDLLEEQLKALGYNEQAEEINKNHYTQSVIDPKIKFSLLDVMKKMNPEDLMFYWRNSTMFDCEKL